MGMANKKISTTAVLRVFGFDYKQALRSFRGMLLYLADYRKFKALLGDEGILFPFGRFQFYFEDRFAEGGTANGHYFHQDLLIARRIYLSKPHRHVDVGSRTDGFIAHVASFREIEVIDIREQKNTIPNIVFKQMDLMSELPNHLYNYTDSLSCLHALEHFGLGRYGDPICPEGYKLGLYNLTKMVRPGGVLYLSVPIGQQRIEFNAHRVFSLNFMLGLLEQDFIVERFSLVDDSGDLSEDLTMNCKDIENSYSCDFGCGIFELRKKQIA
jgi:hypothetical protein